jgi:N-acetylmuramoyl-L-alanine amidase
VKKYYLYIIIFSLVIVSFCCYLIYFISENSVITSAESKNNNAVTVIIDAGHGGYDGGAVGVDGTYEKQLNLEIAQKLDKILNCYGISTLMTRTDDNSIHSDGAVTIREQKVSDIRNRMKIMNNTENCIFVSIHQNSFTQSKYTGTQVFFSPNTTSSYELAESIQDAVKTMLQPENKRQIKKCGNSVYLIYNAKKTAVLVECGFITNPDELCLLKNEDYQLKMAFSIADGIINYLNKGS